MLLNPSFFKHLDIKTYLHYMTEITLDVVSVFLLLSVPCMILKHKYDDECSNVCFTKATGDADERPQCVQQCHICMYIFLSDSEKLNITVSKLDYCCNVLYVLVRTSHSSLHGGRIASLLPCSHLLVQVHDEVVRNLTITLSNFRSMP